MAFLLTKAITAFWLGVCLCTCVCLCVELTYTNTHMCVLDKKIHKIFENYMQSKLKVNYLRIGSRERERNGKAEDQCKSERKEYTLQT